MTRYRRDRFKPGILLILAILLPVLGGCETSSGPKFEQFTQSFDDAVAESESSGRPIMMLFTGSDWCPPCMALEREVIGEPEFEEWASENVVLMLVDQPRHRELDADVRKQNNELFNRYGVSGVPTILFLDQDQEVIGKLGYRPGGPKPWIGAANKLLAKNK